MQPKRVLILVGLICGMVSLAESLRTPTAIAAESKSPIPLQEVLDRGVEGKLGLRLGTVVQVSGEVVANTSTAKADAGVPFFLKITTVNGKSLRVPVLYAFAKQNPSMTLAPQIGDKFSYIGFETGKFQGSPDKESEFVPEYSRTEYGFVTSFVVVATR
jgi:hypothetical protein